MRVIMVPSNAKPSRSNASGDATAILAHPAYWGRWFSPIPETDLRETDLQIFYHLGKALADARRVTAGMSASNALRLLFWPEDWLRAFLQQTDHSNFSSRNPIPVPDSRAAAEELLSRIKAINKRGHADYNENHFITPDDFTSLVVALDRFESDFARECKDINVFTVTDKGTHSPRKLLAQAELNLPLAVRQRLNKKSLADLKAAGRCLAFETPTAAGFHVLRAVEPLIVKYLSLIPAQVSKKKNTSRNWGAYIAVLKKHGGDKRVVAALEHVKDFFKDFYRNPIMHPEVTLNPDQALSLFHACLSLVVQLDAAIQTWRPTTSPASGLSSTP